MGGLKQRSREIGQPTFTTFPYNVLAGLEDHWSAKDRAGYITLAIHNTRHVLMPCSHINVNITRRMVNKIVLFNIHVPFSIISADS